MVRPTVERKCSGKLPFDWFDRRTIQEPFEVLSLIDRESRLCFWSCFPFCWRFCPVGFPICCQSSQWGGTFYVFAPFRPLYVILLLVSAERCLWLFENPFFPRQRSFVSFPHFGALIRWSIKLGCDIGSARSSSLTCVTNPVCYCFFVAFFKLPKIVFNFLLSRICSYWSRSFDWQMGRWDSQFKISQSDRLLGCFLIESLELGRYGVYHGSEMSAEIKCVYAH